MPAVIVTYIIDLYISMIYRDIRTLLERYSIQSPSESKHSINAILQPEIWLQLLIIERIFSLFIPFCPIAEIPRHECMERKPGLFCDFPEAMRNCVFIHRLDLPFCERQ